MTKTNAAVGAPVGPGEPFVRLHRSAAVTAFGVLSIVFAGLNIAFNLFASAMVSAFRLHAFMPMLDVAGAFDARRRFQNIETGLMVPTGIALIVVGISLYRHEERARRWAQVWAIVALVVLAVRIVAGLMILPDPASMIAPAVVLAIYPILLIVVCNLASTRSALTAPPGGFSLPSWGWALIAFGGLGLTMFGGCIVCANVAASRAETIVAGAAVWDASQPTGPSVMPGTVVVTPPPAFTAPPTFDPRPTTTAAPVTGTIPFLGNVPLAKLLSDYNADGPNADSKYKGRVLLTSGKLRDIRRGGAFVSLIVGTEQIAEVVKLECRVSNRDTSVASLKLGQAISVQGTVTGLDLTHVRLEECGFVHPSKTP